MYKSTQQNHDFINRTGTHATRFSLRQYEAEWKDFADFHVPHSDVNRITLDDLKDERARLIAKVRIGESLMRRFRHAGESERSKHAAKIVKATQYRIADLNTAIKRGNVTVHAIAKETAFIRAMKELLSQEQVDAVLQRRIEIEEECRKEITQGMAR